MKFILIWYIAVNIISLILFGIDKYKAVRQKWRIPERSLLLSAFLGGGIGALAGMTIFRHKIRKAKFKILVPLSIIIHIALIILLFRRFN